MRLKIHLRWAIALSWSIVHQDDRTAVQTMLTQPIDFTKSLRFSKYLLFANSWGWYSINWRDKNIDTSVMIRPVSARMPKELEKKDRLVVCSPHWQQFATPHFSAVCSPSAINSNSWAYSRTRSSREPEAWARIKARINPRNPGEADWYTSLRSAMIPAANKATRFFCMVGAEGCTMNNQPSALQNVFQTDIKWEESRAWRHFTITLNYVDNISCQERRQKRNCKGLLSSTYLCQYCE